MREPALVALLAFVVALVVTRAVELWARREQVLDIPNARSSHSVPTPRLGGVGIVAGTLAGLAAALAIGAEGLPGPATVVVVVGLALAGMGLYDDVRHLSVLAKYAAQLVAVVSVSIALEPTLAIDLPGVEATIAGPAAIALAAVWLLALVNAFNFMDGIDGLVGAVTVVTAICGTALVAPAAALILIAVAAASGGFLVWNHAPASVFMGDVGSQFLGLVVGASLLVHDAGRIAAVPVALIASPFLVDTGFTLVRRLREGKNIFAAHREHLYQRLAVAGRSHRSVAAGYALATCLAGVAALAWGDLPDLGQLLVIAGILVAGLGYIAWVGREEARAGSR